MDEKVAGLVSESLIKTLLWLSHFVIKLINLPIVMKRLFLKKEHEYSLALPTHNWSCFEIALTKTQYFTHLRSFAKK